MKIDYELDEEDKHELECIQKALDAFPAEVRRRAFAVNGSVTYMKDGKLVREYKNGRIEIVNGNV